MLTIVETVCTEMLRMLEGDEEDDDEYREFFFVVFEFWKFDILGFWEVENNNFENVKLWRYVGHNWKRQGPENVEIRLFWEAFNMGWLSSRKHEMENV